MKEEVKYTKDVLLLNYPKHSLVLKVLLKDNKKYTKKQCEKILNDFLGKEIK